MPSTTTGITQDSNMDELKVKIPQYLGVHKLIKREDPYIIHIQEAYTIDKLNIHYRKKSYKIEAPATHEIHLTSDTMTSSMDMLHDPKTKIAVFVQIINSHKLLDLIRPRVTGIIFGDDSEESLYYLMTWKDAMRIRDTPSRTKGPNQYPTENFKRIEEGHAVYYLSKAPPEALTLVKQALTRI